MRVVYCFLYVAAWFTEFIEMARPVLKYKYRIHFLNISHLYNTFNLKTFNTVQLLSI